jgi:hypothetical protein
MLIMVVYSPLLPKAFSQRGPFGLWKKMELRGIDGMIIKYFVRSINLFLNLASYRLKFWDTPLLLIA